MDNKKIVGFNETEERFKLLRNNLRCAIGNLPVHCESDEPTSVMESCLPFKLTVQGDDVVISFGEEGITTKLENIQQIGSINKMIEFVDAHKKENEQHTGWEILLDICQKDDVDIYHSIKIAKTMKELRPGVEYSSEFAEFDDD